MLVVSVMPKNVTGGASVNPLWPVLTLRRVVSQEVILMCRTLSWIAAASRAASVEAASTVAAQAAADAAPATADASAAVNGTLAAEAAPATAEAASATERAAEPACAASDPGPQPPRKQGAEAPKGVGVGAQGKALTSPADEERILRPIFPSGGSMEGGEVDDEGDAGGFGSPAVAMQSSRCKRRAQVELPAPTASGEYRLSPEALNPEQSGSLASGDTGEVEVAKSSATADGPARVQSLSGSNTHTNAATAPPFDLEERNVMSVSGRGSRPDGQTSSRGAAAGLSGGAGGAERRVGEAQDMGSAAEGGNGGQRGDPVRLPQMEEALRTWQPPPPQQVLRLYEPHLTHRAVPHRRTQSLAALLRGTAGGRRLSRGGRASRQQCEACQVSV